MYVISGRMKVVIDDGTEAESGPSETVIIPPEYNA
jgi:mannose-6-phosphate isomerase-like protein (cupin superfamily)